ncbi:MAG: alpha-amylase family glycosyl hydrolase [Armatimonadota bacterium]
MHIALHFNRQTGTWDGLSVDGRQVAVAPTAEVHANASPHTFPQPHEWRLVSLERKENITEVTRQAGDWWMRQRFTLDGLRILRDVTLRWDGDEPVRISGVILRTPALRLSDSPEDFTLIPGDFPITCHRFGDLKVGRVRQEAGWTRGEYGIALVHSPSRKVSVVAGYIFRMDQARVGVEEAERGVALRHGFETLLRVRKGTEFAIGTQVIEVVAGDEKRLLEALSHLSDALGNGPPLDLPEHLKGGSLYELHPWGRLESWWAGDRGNRFSRLTALLPDLHELGVTMLWLLPVSYPPPWVYTLPAFNHVAPENGTPQELKEFVQQAHRLGMKVAIDLVVYGVHPESEEVKNLPEEVWCIDEAGNRVRVWGGTVLAADVSHPAWQERIREVVTRWAKEFGFDGARLDVMGWGQAANWRNPYRANASVAYGGLQLNKVVRDAFRAVSRDGFILPEAGKPLAFRHADMLFDYPWYMVMRDITLQPDLARWIREAQEWLEWERCCYPHRALNGLVRFLENHDTVPAAQYFGVGISQSLMAICCLMQGVPLVYQEQEIGFSRELSGWLHLRRRERCLAEGEAEYHSVQCSHPQVFTFLRRADDGAAIVAVNLTGETRRCRLSWAKALSQRFPVCVDAFSGEPVRGAAGSVEVEIPSYRPIVLLLKPRGGKAIPRRSRSVEAAEPTNGRWRILQDGTVRAFGAAQWFVETPEGRLEDAFRDYRVRVKRDESPEDALPVLKRAWHPLEEGLLDGANTASIGVRWADGQELHLLVDVAKASEVRIADEHLDGRQVDLVVKPREAYSIGQENPVTARHEQVDVTSLFVHLRSRGSLLSLARRHGGLPVLWQSPGGHGWSLQGSDLYTDWGLVEKGYASADGETNPRLKVERDGQVCFTGWLRHRAWNGVQSCPVASPGTRYRLGYRLEDGQTLRITIGFTPLSERGETRAFFALRLPLWGFRGWRRGMEGGRAGARTGVRLGERREDGAEPLIVETEKGALRVQWTRGMQNTFCIDSGNGEVVLFLALLDGKPVPLRAGVEWTGEVWLCWG